MRKITDGDRIDYLEKRTLCKDVFFNIKDDEDVNLREVIDREIRKTKRVKK